MADWDWGAQFGDDDDDENEEGGGYQKVWLEYTPTEYSPNRQRKENQRILETSICFLMVHSQLVSMVNGAGLNRFITGTTDL